MQIHLTASTFLLSSHATLIILTYIQEECESPLKENWMFSHCLLIIMLRELLERPQTMKVISWLSCSHSCWFVCENDVVWFLVYLVCTSGEILLWSRALEINTTFWCRAAMLGLGFPNYHEIYCLIITFKWILFCSGSVIHLQWCLNHRELAGKCMTAPVITAPKSFFPFSWKRRWLPPCCFLCVSCMTYNLCWHFSFR